MRFIDKHIDKFFQNTEENLINTHSLLAAIITPCFVFMWAGWNPEMPYYLKGTAWAISISFVLVYCLKYISSFIKRYLSYFFYGICYFATAFAVYLAYFKDFSEGHSLILMLVVFYITLIFEKMRSLLWYLITVLILVVCAVYAEKSYRSAYSDNSFVIVACLVVFSIIAALNLFIKSEDKKALNESKKGYQKLLDTSPDGIIVYDKEQIIYANDEIGRLIKVKDKSSLIGRSVYDFLKPGNRELAVAKIENILDGKNTGYYESNINLANSVTVNAEVANITTNYNGKSAIMTIIRDISERKKMEEKINRMALYDSLTGLPNRYFLNSHLNNSLKISKDSGNPVGLMFIDMDKLKIINDTMGHSLGDAVLQKASQEIKNCLLEGDFIARYGGDEFIVVITNTSPEKAAQTAEKINRRFSSPLNIGQQRIDITLSIGISFYPSDCNDAETLVRYADIAMYESKSLKRNNYMFYRCEMSHAMHRRMQLENGLKKALQNDEFMLHYQPQIDFSTGNIIGTEALIRWNHPELGMVPPCDFISLAEETGLIIPIGEWVLKTACKQSKEWQNSGLPPINMAVNVSYHQLKHRGFINMVQQTLNETGLNPNLLELEITESVLRDIEQIRLVFDNLNPIGIKISVDDFGVGYSSLSMLQLVEINNLKIDMSFTKSITDSPKSAAIVKAIIDLGKNLNCNITAEGVETVDQVNFLKENNCNLGQGYLFSKPLSGYDFEKLFRNWNDI